MICVILAIRGIPWMLTKEEGLWMVPLVNCLCLICNCHLSAVCRNERGQYSGHRGDREGQKPGQLPWAELQSPSFSQSRGPGINGAWFVPGLVNSCNDSKNNWCRYWQLAEVTSLFTLLAWTQDTWLCSTTSSLVWNVKINNYIFAIVRPISDAIWKWLDGYKNDNWCLSWWLFVHGLAWPTKCIGLWVLAIRGKRWLFNCWAVSSIPDCDPLFSLLAPQMIGFSWWRSSAGESRTARRRPQQRGEIWWAES